ncbi:M10 family metallopeptidase [Aerosakkonema funiforme]|uniref:M10 family metallopeptidase n=1 Tax=Aerosakkonema funiforme TaxID=1246630 RepID=UPI0035B7DFCB
MPTAATSPLSIQELYDENFYRANNPDLNYLNSRDLYQQFLNFGLNQGRRFSPYFDANFYKLANPDLSTLTTNRQLVDHFLNSGLANDRKFSQFFDINFYRAANPDLAGFDNIDLFRQFKNFGVSEGFRPFSPVFDINYYRNNNPDLQGLNYRQLYEHFQLSGMGQGREFSPYFDFDIYRARNSELTSNITTNQGLLESFLTTGIEQGLSASLFFDINYYKSKNPSLSNLSNRQLFEQFQFIGLPQGRTFSRYFDLDFYRDANRDLGGLNNKQLWEHFQSFGLKEGRPSSAFFDLDFYRSRNRDLAGLSDKQLVEQLITEGLDQGRSISPFFDLNYYRVANGKADTLSNRQLWQDLQDVGVPGGLAFSQFFDLNLYRNSNPDLAGLSNEQLFEHFQNFGLAEGRIFSPVIDLNVYRNSNADYANLSNRDLFDILVTSGISGGSGGGSAVTQFFDPDFYRTNNPDLVEEGIVTDTQLLEHFQNFGLDDAGRKFSPFLDLDYYLDNNPDLVTAGLTRREAFEHFQRYGLDEGRPFSQFFDVRYYLDNNADLRATGMDYGQAFSHFQNFGVNEGRRPSILFNPVYYLDNNPDLAAIGMSFKDAFVHFQNRGFVEARSASILFEPEDIGPLLFPLAVNQTGDALDLRVNPAVPIVALPNWLQNVREWGDIPANGTLTYSFVGTAGAFLYEGSETNVKEVPESVKNNVRNIMRQYDEVLGINVVEVADTPPNVGRIRIMYSDGAANRGVPGYGNPPSDNPGTSLAGDVHLNPTIDYTQSPGTYNYQTLLSVIGNALGLQNPKKQTLATVFEPVLSFGKDNNTNTVMTDNTPPQTYNGSFASTPMSYDIRALQYLYGAGYANETDTTYRFNTSNFGPTDLSGRNGIKQTIFDAGGIDTFDFSALPAVSFGYYFDMNEGGQNTTQIALNGATYVVPNPNSTDSDPLAPITLNTNSFGTTVAFGFSLENLVGSPGDDEILGNNLSNNIGGGAGNDIINSGIGKDTLTGGAGSDIFVVVPGQGSPNPENADIITDFVDGQDRIGLGIGLSFSQILISPGTNSNDTFIRLARSGEYLAVVTGIPSTAITQSDFTAI